MPNPEVEEPPVTEVETTTVETTPTAETTTTQETSHRLHPDDISAISDNVFNRVKGFATDLVTASQQAAEIAQQMLPPTDVPPPDGAPPPTEEPPPPDQGPVRRHKLFGQPFKRRDN